MHEGVEVRNDVASLEVGDTLLFLWRAPASRDGWLHHLNRIERTAASRPDGILLLSLILPESTPPNAELRQQMQADFRRLGAKLRRFVVVPLGDSIWLSIVRTIVRGTLLLGGQSARQRVSATLSQGLKEVRAAAGPETPSLPELEKAAVALFSALGVTLPLVA
jgi:hypothetical protein